MLEGYGGRRAHFGADGEEADSREGEMGDTGERMSN